MARKPREGDYAAIAEAINTGMARTLWVWAYGWWNAGDGAPTGEGDLIVPFPLWDSPREMSEFGYGEPIPRTPDAARAAAVELAKLYVDLQSDDIMGSDRTITTLYNVALLFDEHDAVSLGEASLFGSRLAEMAILNCKDPADEILELRSWFDDHKPFDLAVPCFSTRLEAQGRTVELVWNGRAPDPRAGRVETSPYGDNPRLEVLGINLDDAPNIVTESIELFDFEDNEDQIEKGRDEGTMADAVLDELGDQFLQQHRRNLSVETVSPGVYRIMNVDRRTGVQYEVHGLDPDEVTKLNEIVRDTLTNKDGEHKRDGRGRWPANDIRRWGRLTYINASDRTFSRNTFVLWFGQFGNVHAVIYADGIEDALEEGMEYIADERPGLLCNESVREEYQRLHREFVAEHGREPADGSRDEDHLREEAEADTTMDGQGNYISSDEWGIDTENPDPEVLRELADPDRGI